MSLYWNINSSSFQISDSCRDKGSCSDITFRILNCLGNFTFIFCDNACGSSNLNWGSRWGLFFSIALADSCKCRLFDQTNNFLGYMGWVLGKNFIDHNILIICLLNYVSYNKALAYCWWLRRCLWGSFRTFNCWSGSSWWSWWSWWGRWTRSTWW